MLPVGCKVYYLLSSSKSIRTWDKLYFTDDSKNIFFLNIQSHRFCQFWVEFFVINCDDRKKQIFNSNVMYKLCKFIINKIKCGKRHLLQNCEAIARCQSTAVWTPRFYIHCILFGCLKCIVSTLKPAGIFKTKLQKTLHQN